MTLKRAAEVIAPILLLTANSDAEAIFKTISSDEQFHIDKNRLGSIFFELIFFYIHLTDRFAYQYIGHEGRVEFLDTFLIKLTQNLAEQHKINGAQIDDTTFLSSFNEAYIQRQKEYGDYKLDAEKGEGLKGTLFWEFDKRVAKILGYEEDSLIITDVEGIVGPAITKYHELIKKFFLEISSGGTATITPSQSLKHAWYHNFISKQKNLNFGKFLILFGVMNVMMSNILTNMQTNHIVMDAFPAVLITITKATLDIGTVVCLFGWLANLTGRKKSL